MADKATAAADLKAEKPRFQFKIGGIAFELQVTVVIVLGMLLPMLYRYGHTPTKYLTMCLDSYAEGSALVRGIVDFYARDFAVSNAINQFGLFFLVPVVVMILGFRERPAVYGLGIGKWRTGLKFLLVVCPILAVSLWFVLQRSDLQQWYQMRHDDSLARIILWNGVEMFGWEYFCRGLLLFGLARAIGPGPAIFLQAMPFAFLHIGKVELEAMSTILSGPAFGYVAWKSQSFLYAWFIHWFMLVLTVCFTMWAG
jgi:membrane protease YdiL (CAAX protease family)